MMHPATQLRWINEEKGFGIVATKLIPKGSITWVQDELDRVFRADEALDLKPLTRQLLDKYSFRNHRGEYILCWDLAKYVNHSFRSNCLSTAYNFEIAIRDIQTGEELTDDYGYLNLSEPFTPQDEGTSRKTVYPDDILKCYKEWDEVLEELFPCILNQDQPMFGLLSDGVQDEVKKVATGKKRMLSTLNLYCKPEESRI
ncbi:SET domain-containing protein [Gramella sp. KN1008]|uniref:SET domain-containing protein n=1 Tax=Gramella sp. KN1008 TaxID=2529298 RepID=UPI00103DAB4E|nr:SET domain-containing protein [Gramella sp. KN1008]TBW29880.1 SET domain-containing protein-lysine N-methyltransferase [Gramella sp. KN1008]